MSQNLFEAEIQFWREQTLEAESRLRSAELALAKQRKEIAALQQILMQERRDWDANVRFWNQSKNFVRYRHLSIVAADALEFVRDLESRANTQDVTYIALKSSLNKLLALK